MQYGYIWGIYVALCPEIMRKHKVEVNWSPEIPKMWSPCGFVIVRRHSEPKSFCRCRLTGALATASGDDAVRVFKEDETANPEEPVFSLAAQVARAHNQDVNCVSWNPKEAGFLASCSDNGEIAIWKFQEEEWTSLECIVVC